MNENLVFGNEAKKLVFKNNQKVLVFGNEAKKLVFDEIQETRPVPESLNPLIWLDSSIASSKHYSSGSILSQWDDLSGNDLHMDTVVGTPTSTTINPVVTNIERIGRLGSGLSLINSDFTIAYVVNINHSLVSTRKSIVAGTDINTNDPYNYYNAIHWSNGNLSFQSGNGSGTTLYNGSSADHLQRKIIVINRLEKNGLYKQRQIFDDVGDFNFSSSPSANKHKTIGWSIGGTTYNPTRNTSHYEYLIFSYILTDEEVEEIVLYLKNKWEISVP